MTKKTRKSFEELEQKYAEFKWENLSSFTISPGLIDLNVSFNNELLIQNEEYEELESECSTSIMSSTDPKSGYELGTKAAISGGVTTVIETPSIYHRPYEVQDYILNIEKLKETELYCDIGLLAHIHSDNLDEIQALSSAGIMGFKIFTISPAFEFPFLSFEKLEEALALFENCQKPFFFYPEKTSERFVYIGSPYRSQNILSRIDNKIDHFLNVFPAAFPDSVELSGSEISPPSAMVSTPVMTPISATKLLADDKTLEKHLQLQANDIESLVSAEMLSYVESGTTVFKENSPLRIYEGSKKFVITLNNCSSEKVETPVKTVQENRVRRPPPIQCLKPVPNKKDHDYKSYLGNYSYRWEISGVETILAAIKKFPKCKAHISNLSLAESVHIIGKTKKELPELQLTSETAGFYLYFSSEQIKAGDTRFKASPPIREEKNRKLMMNVLLRNEVDAISSFHRPIKPQLKFLKSGDFKRAVSGISSIGTTLQVMNTLYKGDPRFTACKLAKLLSETPALIIGLPNKGTISKGNLADLVIWDPLSPSDLSGLHMRQVSPFSGEKLQGRIFQTYLHGKLVFSHESLTPNGRLLQPCTTN